MKLKKICNFITHSKFKKKIVIKRHGSNMKEKEIEGHIRDFKGVDGEFRKERKKNTC